MNDTAFTVILFILVATCPPLAALFLILIFILKL